MYIFKPFVNAHLIRKCFQKSKKILVIWEILVRSMVSETETSRVYSPNDYLLKISTPQSKKQT